MKVVDSRRARTSVVAGYRRPRVFNPGVRSRHVHRSFNRCSPRRRATATPPPDTVDTVRVARTGSPSPDCGSEGRPPSARGHERPTPPEPLVAAAGRRSRRPLPSGHGAAGRGGIPHPRRFALPQPRAVVARFQRARARARRGRGAAAARAREVPRDLQLQPRRVLPGARVRAPGAARGGRAQRRPRRARPGRAAPRDPRARRRARRAARPRVFTKEVAPRARKRRASSSPTGTSCPTTSGPSSPASSNDRIFPVLTPLAVDPAHPFPYISNLSLNLAVVVRDPATRRAAVRARQGAAAAAALRRDCPDARGSSPLEQVIAAHLDALFPGMEVLAHHPFRVTRDADFELTDEAEDLLAAMESVLRQRTKFGAAVRLEVDPRMTPDVLDLLCRELELSAARRVRHRRPARPGRPVGRSTRCGGPSSSTRRSRRRPRPRSPASDEPDVLWAMRDGDVLVHHPYDSFATSVEAFVDQAARDPAVLAIKQTLYRTGGDEAGIVAVARQGGRARQAGGGARRAEGALRRAGEHRAGAHARASRRARRVRARRPEDPRQDPARGAPGGRRHPALLPRRHRQLQPEDRHALRGPRCALDRPGARRRPHGAVQPPHRLQPCRASTASCSSRPTHLRADAARH